MLGIAGLVGSRRTELLNTLFGYYARESGKITLNGKEVSNNSAFESQRSGFALLTEERRATGIIPLSSVGFNSTIANIRAYGSPLLSNRKMAKENADQIAVRRQSAEGYHRALAADQSRCAVAG